MEGLKELRGDHSENIHSDSDEGDSYHYHAVYFSRGSMGTFYIGRQISRNSEEMTMTLKFLERIGARVKFMYDWPKRDDVVTVPVKFVLEEIQFEGPPPFTLDNKTLRQIEAKGKQMKY